MTGSVSLAPGHDISIQELREQLQQLTLMVSSQADTINRLETAQSSGASVPSPAPQPLPPPPRTEGSRADDLVAALADSLRRTVPQDVEQASERALANRSRTLANLLSNAPKYDGTGDILLWKKRIMEYLDRRRVREESMALDVLQEACQRGASEFLGSVEWPLTSIDGFWEVMESRYARSTFARMADYENLKMRPGQTYRRYSDILMEKAYGLNIPKEALLRKFLQTMLHGNELRRYLIGNISMYNDTRELAAAVEQLTENEEKWRTDAKPASAAVSMRCRACGKTGHFAAACPQRTRRAPKPVAAVVEYLPEEPDESQVEYEEDICHEDVTDYDEQIIESADVAADVTEKRAAEHQASRTDLIKRLRGPGRPSKSTASASRAWERPPPTASQPAPPTRLTQVPLRGYRVPVPGVQRPAAPRQYPSGLATRPPRGMAAPARSLRRTMEGMVDVPATTLMGLVMKASGNAHRLADQWMTTAMQEASGLLDASDVTELEDMGLELEELGEIEELHDRDPAAQVESIVVNPLTTTPPRYVGYMPVKLGTDPAVYWALADTGAMVSVISAGLASYLNLYADDMRNVYTPSFAVKGYNESSSYMPILETPIRLGARGGEERSMMAHMCILDSNGYKLIIGVDILQALDFVYDGPGRRLHLTSAGIKFSLPLVTRNFAFNAPAVRSYLEAATQVASPRDPAMATVEIATGELEEFLAEGESAQYDNALSKSCRDTIEESLEPLLYLAELVGQTQQTNIKTEDRECRVVATITPRLAQECFDTPLESGYRLTTTVDDETWNQLQVDVNPQDEIAHLCHCEETIGDPIDVTALTPESAAQYLTHTALALQMQPHQILTSPRGEVAHESLADIPDLPEAIEISSAQFTSLTVETTVEPTVETILPAQQNTGDMGTAELPGKSPPIGMNEGQLTAFLQKHGLEPSEGRAPLGVRAAKLKAAIESNAQLVDPARTSSERQQIYQMLLGVADVFATHLDDLATPAAGEKFHIDTGDHTPIKQRPFKTGQREIDFLKETIAGQMGAGIIQPSMSPWSSPAFVAYARPYGTSGPPKQRKVIDYRRLNRITRGDTYPLPDISEMLDWFSTHEYFGALDLKSGYWQKETVPADRCKTAFVIPGSLHEYTRVPFGLKNAPAFFQRAITNMLASHSISHSRGFVDDLLTGGSTWMSYLAHQKHLLEVLRDNHWLVTIGKVRLGYQQISILGHVVGHQYVKPDPEKIAAVKRIRPPSTVSAVRAFLGLVGFYRRFLPGFAKIARPLTQLLRQDIPFEWGPQQETAFRQLQDQLTALTMLHTPTASGRFRVYTDYSSEALGAALHQIQEEVEKPIAFASRLCRGPESTLSSAEGELCALVYALGKFRSYLGFEEFDIITDSNALTSLQTNQNLSSKLARWSILLSEFNFKLIHKPGASHTNADGLSRCKQQDELGTANHLHVWTLSTDSDFLRDDTPSCQGPGTLSDHYERALMELNTIRAEYRRECRICGCAPKGRMLSCGRCGNQQHATCEPNRPPPCYWYCGTCRGEIQQYGGPQDLSEDTPALLYLLGGNRPHGYTQEEIDRLDAYYSIKRGLLLVEMEPGHRVFPTVFDRMQLVEKYHDALMHAGWRATAEALQERYYWPNLASDARWFCTTCLACQLESAVFRRSDSIMGHLSASAPRTAWSMDCAPSIGTSTGGRASILIIVDDFTRYVQCIVIPHLDSKSVKTAFIERILAVYGRPHRVRTDGGKEFQGEFTALLEALGIQRIMTRPAAPWTNGRAERMVRFVKSRLRRSLYDRDGVTWQELLPWVTASINATVSRSTGYSPHEVFFGEPPRPLVEPSGAETAVPHHFGEQGPETVELYVRRIRRHLQVIWQRAAAIQRDYESRLETEYGDYPVAGTTSIAKKVSYRRYQPGELVLIKQQKGALGKQSHHFALGASGPWIVIEDQGRSVLAQGTNGQRRWQSKANCLPMKH